MPGREPGTDLDGLFELEMWFVVAIVVTIVVTIMLHMVHGAAVAFTETFAECSAVPFIHRRTFVDIVVIRVGVAMVDVVPAGRFDAFVEPGTLGVLVGVRYTIPVVISILVLRCRRQRLCWRSFSLQSARGGNAEGKHRGGKPFYFHRNIYLRVTAIKMREEVAALPVDGCLALLNLRYPENPYFEWVEPWLW